MLTAEVKSHGGRSVRQAIWIVQTCPVAALHPDGQDGAEARDDGGEDFQGAVDFAVGGVAGEAEADGAVGDAGVEVHGLEDGGGFEAAAGTGGAGGGADALFAK